MNWVTLSLIMCIFMFAGVHYYVAIPSETISTEHSAEIIKMYHDDDLLGDDYYLVLLEDNTTFSKRVWECQYILYDVGDYYNWTTTERIAVGNPKIYGLLGID